MSMYQPKANLDMLRGFKIQLFPTKEQEQFLDTQFLMARYVYNWALEQQDRKYEEDKSYIDNKHLKELLAEEYQRKDWLAKSFPVRSAQIVLRHVDYAYKSFFKGQNRHPKYKSRKYSKKSLEVRNDPNAFYFTGTKVRIAGLPFGDMIECGKHYIPRSDVRGEILYYRIVISYDGFRYWLSLNSEVDKSYLKEHEPTEYKDESIGIDLGLRTFAVLSDGTEYDLPKDKLRKLKKRQSRQKSRLSKLRRARAKHKYLTPISKNERKLAYQEYKTRRRIYNIKHSFVHQVTTEIANRYPKRIVMEDLSVSTLVKMRHFSKRNTGILYDARYMMSYKCRDRGIEFVLAHDGFPSSQICSFCGYRIGKSSQKRLRCPNCGTEFDRDLNAAINLSRYNPEDWGIATNE